MTLYDYLERFCRWKAENDDPVDFEEDEEGNFWLVLAEQLHRVSISVVDLDDPYDDLALVVECAIGAYEDFDPRELLSISGARMFVSRFSLVPRVGEPDLLIVEAAAPYQMVSLPLFDRMLREVLSMAAFVLSPPAPEDL